jgi:hypothetical protein
MGFFLFFLNGQNSVFFLSGTSDSYINIDVILTLLNTDSYINIDVILTLLDTDITVKPILRGQHWSKEKVPS